MSHLLGDPKSLHWANRRGHTGVSSKLIVEVGFHIFSPKLFDPLVKLQAWLKEAPLILT